VKRIAVVVKVIIGIGCLSSAAICLAQPTISREKIPADAPAEVKQQIQRLYSDDIEERGAAITALGRMGEKAAPAAPFLIDMLPTHRDPGVINALLGIGKPAFKPVLKALDDPRVRLRAARVLALMNYPEVTQGLVAALKHESLRRTIARALLKRKDPRTADLLIAALKDNNPILRAGAAYVLRDLAAPSTTKMWQRHLIETRIWHKDMTRGEAMDLVAEQNGRAAEALLVGLKDEVAEVRALSANGLGRASDTRAVQPLIAALKDEESDVRREAASALGRLKDARAVEPLLELLKNDQVAAVRAAAVGALAMFPDDRVEECLVEAIKDEDTEVRNVAARLVTRRRSPRSFELLVPLLKHEDATVREHATDALGALRDPRAIEHLAVLLEDEEIRVRRKAVAALGKLKDGRAVKMLVGVLENEDEGIRRSALNGLTYLKDPHAIQPLIDMLKQPDKRVQRNAAGSLKRITGQDLGTDHAKWQAQRQPTRGADPLLIGRPLFLGCIPRPAGSTLCALPLPWACR